MWSLIMRRLLGRSQLFTWLHNSSPLHQLLVLSREPHETWEAFLKNKLLAREERKSMWTVQFQNILPCYAPLHESPGETRNSKRSYKRMKVTSKPGSPRALLLPMCVPGGHHLVLLGVSTSGICKIHVYASQPARFLSHAGFSISPKGGYRQSSQLMQTFKI